MSDRQLNYKINLAGNLDQRATQISRSISNMEQRSTRSLSLMSRGFTNLEHGMDRVMNRTTALVGGLSGAVAVKYVVDLDERIARLGVNAGASAEAMAVLKGEIFAVAQTEGIKIDPSELTSAIELIVEKTGDLDFAKRNMETFAKVMSATGAGGEDIGALGAEFQKFGITTRDDVAMSMAILNDQGKAGAFTLKSLASLGPRVVSAYAAAGRSGVPALREMGAALQVIRQGTGSDEQAATAFEALMRTFADADKVKALQGKGIQVFDSEKLKQGERVLRPVNELIADIITKTKGDSIALGKLIPDAEAQRAFNASVAEFKRTGSIESLHQFLNVQGDVNRLNSDSAVVAQTAAAAWRGLTAAGKQFADLNLVAPIQATADVLNDINPEKLQKSFQIMSAAVVAFLVVWGTLKTATAVGGVARGVWGAIGKKGAAGGIAGAIGAASGATPVYVVNMPGGGIGGGVADAAGNTPAGKAAKVGKLAKIGRMAGAATGLGLAGYAGYEAGSYVNDKFIAGTALQDLMGGFLTRSAAALGSKDAQETMALKKSQESRQQKIDMNLHVTADGQVQVKNVKASDGTNLNVGNTTGAHF